MSTDWNDTAQQGGQLPADPAAAALPMDGDEAAGADASPAEAPSGEEAAPPTGPPQRGRPDSDLPEVQPPGDEVQVSHALELLLRRDGELLAAEDAVYRYDDERGVWNRLDDARLGALCQRFSGELYFNGYKEVRGEQVPKYATVRISQRSTKGTVALLKQRLHTPDAFDQARSGISLKDGSFIIDELGELSWCPHDPDHRLRYFYPWTRAEVAAARAPRWHEQTLGLVGGELAVAEMLYEWAGLALLGQGTRWQKAVVLEGEGGDGKGSWMKALESVFPDDSVTAVPVTQCHLAYNPAKLVGKLLCSVGDLPNMRISAQASATWKSMVAGDRTNARQIYGPPFTYTPTAAWIWSCNELPEPADLSHGWWRRILVVPCCRVAPPEGQPGHIECYEDVLKAEGAGIVHALLAGATRALKRGRPDVPDTVRDATNRWRLEATSSHPLEGRLTQWLIEQVEEGGVVTAERALTDVWGEQRSRHRSLSRELGELMKALGWKLVRRRVGGRPTWFYEPTEAWAEVIHGDP